MPRRSLLLAAAIVSFIAVLVASFPARVAYRWFAPASIKLNQIRGTVWSGSADAAEAAGFYLQDVTWAFRPLRLLSGKLAYGISASPALGFIDTGMEVGVTGDIAFTNLRGSLPLRLAEQASGMQGLRGEANIRMERLRLRDGIPVAADGEVVISGLVAPLIYRDSIGGYRAEFFTQNSGVVASLEDTDGVVDLAGSVQIAPDGTYQFTALLAPKATTPASLRQQMQFLGTANARGQYEMRLEGRL